MNASIASAKGIEEFPLCGSDLVLWRRRRPTDFALTWIRLIIEWVWAGVVGHGRIKHRQRYLAEEGFIDSASIADVPEVQAEVLEANTAHKTPKLFWRCKACHREGHVF